MTLDAFLQEHGMTETAFAAAVGVDQSTINRVRRGHMPSPRVIAAIFEKSKGAVTPNDLMMADLHAQGLAQMGAQDHA